MGMYIMNIKIDDIKRDINDNKVLIANNKRNFENIVRPGTIVDHEYRLYEKDILEDNWRRKKEKNKQTRAHLKDKFAKRVNPKEKEEVPDKLFGVRISDRVLEDINVANKVSLHDALNEVKAIKVNPKDTF